VTQKPITIVFSSASSALELFAMDPNQQNRVPLFYAQRIHCHVSVTLSKCVRKNLRKSAENARKGVDGKRPWEHYEEGSKRFEEQQASGNVADLER
jgi:hypothetical protein